MKLKFIKESIIIDEKNSNVDDQPSKKTLKGFRSNILDYIKREFVNTVKKTGLLCVLDEKSNPMTLKIQRPKNMDIIAVVARMIFNISKELKISDSRFSKYLRECGIETNKYHKPKIDENVFNIIDTEEKAYWLGFLYADGCITKRNGNN